MPTKWIESKEELTEIVKRLKNILPNTCMRTNDTLMYARFFMKGGKWIYYIAAHRSMGDDEMFYGYCTHEPMWMPWKASQMGSISFIKDALEILPEPLPLGKLLELSRVAPE